jgi:hypothetical protein
MCARPPAGAAQYRSRGSGRLWCRRGRGDCVHGSDERPRITALILDSNVRPPHRGNRCTDFDKAAELGDAVGRRLIWDTLAWAGIIGVPTNCAAQEGTAKRLKGGPFAVVFAGAVATCSGLKKIGFIAHGL